MGLEGIYVGIDVAKAKVDVAVRPTSQRWVVSYDETGVGELVSQLEGLGPTLVLLEATGGLELPLVAALAIAELPVVVANPRQVRDFAKATGALAKTDAIGHPIGHDGQRVEREGARRDGCPGRGDGRRRGVAGVRAAEAPPGIGRKDGQGGSSCAGCAGPDRMAWWLTVTLEMTVASSQQARGKRSPAGRARRLLNPFSETWARAIINAVYGFSSLSRTKAGGSVPGPGPFAWDRALLSLRRFQ